MGTVLPSPWLAQPGHTDSTVHCTTATGFTVPLFQVPPLTSGLIPVPIAQLTLSLGRGKTSVLFSFSGAFSWIEESVIGALWGGSISCPGPAQGE